ncbi:MAG: hypothetical protein IT375_13145 [Polyangiaceae bacterium]|nr:hypothetical protein [Polyangiaceae bacterium]MCK6538187.1 DUF4139 domain-containing protein [Polyangiaceae bacterium]
MQARTFSLFVPAFVSLLGCQTAGQGSAAPSVLPLRSLKLYETGVGYFERSGTLARGETTTLPVPTGHLDDALKTLVIAGNSGATLTGVEFSSSLSRGMARALAGLPANADEPTTYHNLLSSLKGAEVEVRTSGKKPETLVGRLIDVLEPPAQPAAPPKSSDADDKKGKEPETPKPELTLLLVTKDGELRKLDTSQVASVRPTDPSYLTRVGAALDALSVRAAQNQRSLRLLAQSDKPVTLGYLAESPIWRTTYRLVMADGGERGTLQAWALIHNDTEETWAKVQIELVNGQPDSFLYPLAAPRYGRRELAEPEERLATVPQLQDTTVDQIWGDNLDVGTIGHGSGTGTGAGYGSGHGRVGGSHRTRSPTVRMGATVSSSEALSVGNLAAIVPAEGVEAGALFSYKLAQPLDLRAHGSALVPFLQSSVVTRRISWFTGPGSPARSALRFVNATRQTLPAGPIALYEGGGFAGEAGLSRLKPTERAFLQFGVDLDVELDSVDSESKDHPQQVRFKNQYLEEDFFRQSERKYALKNRSRAVRTVYLSLDVVNNSTVEGADELDYDVSGRKPLAVFKALPGKKLERTLKIKEGLQSSTHISNLTAKRLNELSALEVLPAADRALLKEAAARIEEAEARTKENDEAKDAIEEVTKDLERLRQHLTALGDKSGQGANANPLVKRILDAEDKLTALRTKSKALEVAMADKRKAAQAVLEKLPKREPKK